VTVKEKEEMEQTSKSAPTEEEHADELLTLWEMELRMLEDWLDHPEPTYGCKETVMISGEEHSVELLRNFGQEAEQMETTTLRSAAEGKDKLQSGEPLEEAGDAPAGELAEAKLSEKEAEQQLSGKTAEMNFAVGWQAKATRDGENRMGDRIDLPICREEVQPRRLHKENQQLEQLDEEVEEIRKMMLRSAAESVSKGMNRREPAIVAGKMQQQRSGGADGQLQRTVWDPGGFQQQSWEAHEQELMNFCSSGV
jgi:hypothetical protein